MITEWNIQKRSSSCVTCNKAFEDNEQIYCFLNLQKREEFRKDHCSFCWEETKLDRAGVEFFSCWQTQFRKAVPITKEEPVKRDQVEVMLKKYIHSEKPAHINLCYILAVMLERKKVLVHKDSIRDQNGKKVLVYENHKTGETFVIADPELKLSQIVGVQQQVRSLLDEETRQPIEIPLAESTAQEEPASIKVH